jgi:hypothetical protein
MTMRITGRRMTSDLCAEVAELRDGRWLVTGYPGRTFDRSQAITAMTLAELMATDLPPGDPTSLLVSDLRGELDIPEADGPHGPTA